MENTVLSELIEILKMGTFITHERYAQLLKAEHDANLLKDLILQKANNYGSLDYKEILLLKDLYYYPAETTENESIEEITKIESEENENGSK